MTTATAASTAFYQMRGVGKTYLNNPALVGVDLDFSRGRITGLIGKNGAGKSTLVNIMYGAIEPSSGQILIDGKDHGELTPPVAQDLGIFLVPQKVQHAHDLTIAQNLFLGRYPRTRFGLVDTAKMADEAKRLMARVGLDLSPNLMLGRLSIEQRRLLDVAKALWIYQAKMVILDETTAALGLSSRRILFDLVRQAKAENRSIIFITHRLEEILDICDDVVVIRDGRVVGQREIAEVSAEILAEMIIGRSQDVVVERDAGAGATAAAGAPLCELSALGQPGRFHDVSFRASANEIIGIAGMLGSGYNDILRCIGGVDTDNTTGVLRLHGRAAALGNPRRQTRQGLAYLTNNREEEGLLHTMSVKENMFCGTYRHFTKRGLLDRQKITNTFADRVRLLDIKLHSPDLLIDSLSGGNKQKVLVSRLLNQHTDILLLDEPAEGIDIEARTRLLQFIDQVARHEKLVIIASNVVEDLITVCDRILVVYHGRVCHSFERADFDEQAIYSAIQGLEPSRRRSTAD